MSQIDWLVLLITFVTSLFASIITGIFISKPAIYKHFNHHRPNKPLTNTQQPNVSTFKSPDTNIKRKRNVSTFKPLSNKHTPYKSTTCTSTHIQILPKTKPQKHTSHFHPQPSLLSPIPTAPKTPPTSINKMHWMDGKWQPHTENRFILINSNHFDFKQVTKQNQILSHLLMESIPSLSKDTIQIIYSFICDINLCISKYALLDYQNKYIQFFINDLDFNQYTKTMIIPLNAHTQFSQQILNQISKREQYISNISHQLQNPQIECNIYFHDNHNAIINDKYFILSLFCDTNTEIDMQCNILCQFQTNNIQIIKRINLHWTASLWSSKLGSFAKSKLCSVRFDGKYIYTAKDNILSVNSFDPKVNVLQNVILKREPNKHAITCYRIYDCYLMVSRVNYTKLELYKIDSNNIRYLYHEFELEQILNKMNKNYHLKFDKNGRVQRDFDERFDTILGFEMHENNILFCVYYNRNLNRLFVANIKLSIFDEPKLIKYNLLDGKIGNIIQSLNWKIMYKKCLGIESIYINNRKDWLVFFECENPWDLLCEIEFRINCNDLNVKYGKRKAKATSCRYLRSDHRKQMSLSCFMI